MSNTKLCLLAKINRLILPVSGLLKSAFKCINALGIAFNMTVCMVITLLPSQAIAQQQNSSVAALPPIVSFLLFDEGQCPAISPTTTRTISTPITTQAELDALQGVTRIEGDLEFNTRDTLLDFSPLDSLVQLTGTLRFRARSNTTISGFGCLSTIGGSFVNNFNSGLKSVSGFDSLRSVGGGISFSENFDLTSVSGFDRLTSVGGSLEFIEHFALRSISGFDSLRSVGGGIQFFENVRLNSIPGFDSLRSIGGSLAFEFNDALTSLPEFDSLASIGDDLLIQNNALLISIDGFGSLKSEDVADRIVISSNPNLDCTNPEPNFLPVSFSTGNQVNCVTTIE